MKDKINWERERQREISERTRSEKGKKKTLSASFITIIICIASRLLTALIFHLNPAKMKKDP